MEEEITALDALGVRYFQGTLWVRFDRATHKKAPRVAGPFT